MPRFDVLINGEHDYNNIEATDDLHAVAQAAKMFAWEKAETDIHSINIKEHVDMVSVPLNLFQRLLDGYNGVADVPLTEEEIVQLFKIAWPEENVENHKCLGLCQDSQ